MSEPVAGIAERKTERKIVPLKNEDNEIIEMVVQPIRLSSDCAINKRTS